MKKLLVALFLITGLSVLTFGASEIIWLSTQFNPIEEAEWVRGVLLPPFTNETGVDVTFIGSEYGEFVDRLIAESKAGSGTIDVVCALHGDFVSVVDSLADSSVALAGVEGTIAPSAVELGQMGEIQAYVPMMQATY
ncbi:extracellular solute-binding protein, partial [Candidatus Bipolaricaulota bacterium]|nr:extracellular solute-binding protein [Candidatus Bipolaricaulota bacterium]